MRLGFLELETFVLDCTYFSIILYTSFMTLQTANLQHLKEDISELGESAMTTSLAQLTSPLPSTSSFPEEYGISLLDSTGNTSDALSTYLTDLSYLTTSTLATLVTAAASTRYR